MNYVGLDLGQARDHSAFAVVSREHAPSWAVRGDARGQYLVRYVGRAPLGTPYPQIVEGVRRIVRNPQMGGQVVLVVDGTGVGAPVVDMLRRAGLGCELCAVTITGGERQTHTGQVWNVPKTDLMAGLRVLLESGELRIARHLPNLGVLVRELMDVQVVMKEGGKARIGADRAGQHDDLVIALALAAWRAKRREIGMGGGRLPGI